MKLYKAVHPDGMKHGYLVVRTDELEDVMAAVAQNWGWL